MARKKITNKNEGSFERLSPEKQEKVIHACIDEFAEAGYDKASTGGAAKRAGIAKGSIFKYFGTKEHMFFHMGDHVMKRYLIYLEESTKTFPKDILQRFRLMQEKLYEFFGVNPSMFKFLMMVGSQQGGSGAHKMMRDKWEPLVEPLYMKFLEGSDMKHLRVPVKDLIRMIKWLDFAMDTEIMGNIKGEITPEELRKIYKPRLDLIFDVLENGIYK